MERNEKEKKAAPDPADGGHNPPSGDPREGAERRRKRAPENGAIPYLDTLVVSRFL